MTGQAPYCRKATQLIIKTIYHAGCGSPVAGVAVALRRVPADSRDGVALQQARSGQAGMERGREQASGKGTSLGESGTWPSCILLKKRCYGWKSNITRWAECSGRGSSAQ
jgi:hypothetical protein